MSQNGGASEHTRLLDPRVAELGGGGRKPSRATSIVSSHVSKEEQVLAETAVGERLPYNGMCKMSLRFCKLEGAEL